MRPIRSLLLGLCCLTASPALAQTAGGASVVVASVEGGDIMGANGIDAQINADMAGRIGLAILAHKWLEQDHTPGLDEHLEGGDPELTIGMALDRGLEDGRTGEMSRALIAARIGYTPLLLDSAVKTLFDEARVPTTNLGVRRGAWGGPEWTGSISARDTARLAVVLARMQTFGTGPMLAGAGLECVAVQPGEHTATRWVAVVSGAVSPEGCLAAAHSSVALTDERVAQAERIDPTESADSQAKAALATQALGLPSL